MNEPKQTAVGYIELKVKSMIENGGCEDLLPVLIHIEQAKEMERQQIIDAWIDGKETKEFGYSIWDDAEQYYKETYEKD